MNRARTRLHYLRLPLLALLLALTASSNVMASVPAISSSVERPQRIVTLAPSITEIVFALGAGERIVGVSDFCNYPPETAKIPKLGTLYSIKVETLVTAKPDLVIAIPSAFFTAHAEQLHALGIRTLEVKSDSFEDVFSSIAAIAKALGIPERGEALTKEIKDSLTAATQKVGAKQSPPRVLVVVEQSPLYVAGRNSYISELIERAGGRNVYATDTLAYTRTNIEKIIALKPDIIIDTTQPGAPESAKELPAFWKPWAKHIPAIEKGRLYLLQNDRLLRPGPRMVEGVELLIKILHPDLSLDSGKTGLDHKKAAPK